MKFYYGKHKKNSYFEGWYLKHDNGNEVIAFIPAFHVDKNGISSASIQVVSDRGSWNFTFRPTQFKVFKDCVKIGRNLFGKTGAIIHLKGQGISIDGYLSYKGLTPLRFDIMGPFQFVPFMQCRHEVISMRHFVNGQLKINGEIMIFKNGFGYMEKDRGCSFPARYLWAQGSKIKAANDQQGLLIMLAIADIPLLGRSFRGCISSIFYNNKEYRLATYWGASVLVLTKNSAVITQGPYLLRIKKISSKGLPVVGASQLKAPKSGDMCRVIYEHPSCQIRCQLSKNKHILFDTVCERSGFEVDQSL